MKKLHIFFVLLTCPMLLFLLSCGVGGRSTFVGRWYMVEGIGENIPHNLELLKDGTGFASNQALTWKALKDRTGFVSHQAITWKAENNRLFIMHPDLSMAFDCKISSSKLEFYDKGKKFVYTNKLGGTSAIVGTWVSISFDFQPVTDEDWLKFNRDGTGISLTGNEFKWITRDAVLFMIYGYYTTINLYEIKSGTLTLERNSNYGPGMSVEIYKKK